MTYSEAIQKLFQLQLFGARLSLETALELAEAAGNPHRNLRFIHVAGTNGKGSTCAMLEAIYRRAGLRVGLYTSPHLVSFRERIQVNRTLVSEADTVELITRAEQWQRALPPGTHPTFFEVITIMALQYFAEQRCNLVIWETGLGGRLDATNIVTPLASVITNIQFDHESWLGNTIEQIAREKAGIIKPGIPVTTAAEHPDALRVIREIAAERGSPLHLVTAEDADQLPSIPSLAGAHQRLNAALAVQTVELLDAQLHETRAAIVEGLQHVEWPGRFQVLQRGSQTIVLDGAHNPGGAATLAQTLRTRFPNQPCTIVLGVLEDKRWAEVCQIIAPLGTRIIVSPVSSPRSANPDSLRTACANSNPKAEVIPAKSLRDALNLAAADPLVVVTGSLYFVGEAMELLGLGDIQGERGLNDYTRPAPAGPSR